MISNNIGVLFDLVANAGGIWAYTTPAKTSKAFASNNSIGLALSNSMYTDGRVDANGNPYRVSIGSEAIAGMSASERIARSNASISAEISTKNAAITTIHELIHLSLAGGASDQDLAIAALSFTGEELVEEKLKGISQDDRDNITSGMWDDRLAQACGGQRRAPTINQYIRRK